MKGRSLRNCSVPAGLLTSGPTMELNLSREQFEALLKAVYLGDWMVNAIRVPGSYVPEFEELEKSLLSLAHGASLNDTVEFDPNLSEYFFKEEFHEMLRPIC